MTISENWHCLNNFLLSCPALCLVSASLSPDTAPLCSGQQWSLSKIFVQQQVKGLLIVDKTSSWLTWRGCQVVMSTGELLLWLLVLGSCPRRRFFCSTLMVRLKQSWKIFDLSRLHLTRRDMFLLTRSMLLWRLLLVKETRLNVSSTAKTRFQQLLVNIQTRFKLFWFIKSYVCLWFARESFLSSSRFT